MVKRQILSLTGEKIGSIELPSHFNETIRPDLIKRAVLAIHSHNYQPYGSDPLAGTRQGKATPKRRRKFGTTYGYGISRVKRKRLWRRGERFGWVAAFVANVVGGRKAFPPKAEKKIKEKINKKERRKAIRSAIAATSLTEFVSTRHVLDKLKELPIIIEDKFEELKKAKEVVSVLEKLGLKKELQRTKTKKVRAGKGKMRGRKYRKKIGPLIITSKSCPLLQQQTYLV